MSKVESRVDQVSEKVVVKAMIAAVRVMVKEINDPDTMAIMNAQKRMLKAIGEMKLPAEEKRLLTAAIESIDMTDPEIQRPLMSMANDAVMAERAKGKDLGAKQKAAKKAATATKHIGAFLKSPPLMRFAEERDPTQLKRKEVEEVIRESVDKRAEGRPAFFPPLLELIQSRAKKVAESRDSVIARLERYDIRPDVVQKMGTSVASLIVAKEKEAKVPLEFVDRLLDGMEALGQVNPGAFAALTKHIEASSESALDVLQTRSKEREAVREGRKQQEEHPVLLR